MSFPFGGFKNPDEPRRGHYSGSPRDLRAEMEFDEGDADPLEDNLAKSEKGELREEFERCWREKINAKHELYDHLDLRVWALGQSHIDLAWLWRLYQSLNKARITWSKAVFHIRHVPGFTFTASQPVLLDWVRLADPDLFARIKEAARSGRFELQGGSWVEADQKIPSGESFCRSRLYGQRFYAEHFGKVAEVEWLTDSFGYNNNLPQFVRKSGGKYFLTLKIAGNWPPDAFPFWNFKWRSPSGEEVLAHVTNFQFRPLTRWKLFGATRRILRPGTTLACNYSTPDPASAPELGDVWPEVLVVYGTGDGGHGPTSEEVHRMKYYVDGGRVAGFTTAAGFFERLEAVGDRLPVWDGAELYYNLHRGTLTTQGLVKRMNRFFEWRLSGLESLHAWATFVGTGKGNREGPRETHGIFERLWKDLLLLQFHDILPGSSIPEVYDDCYDIWTEDVGVLARLEGELVARFRDVFFQSTSNPRGATHLFLLNQSAHAGVVPVEVPIPSGGTEFVPPGFQFLGAEQRSEPLLSRPARLLCCVKVDPWSPTVVSLDELGGGTPVEVKIDDACGEITLDSSHARVVVSRTTGDVSSYFDKNLGREVLSAPGGVLKLYRDWAFDERAWNLGPGYRKCPFEGEEFVLESVEVVETGPVRWSVRARFLVPESDTTVVESVQLYRDIPGLFIELDLDWRQTDAVLKAEFTLASDPEVAVAEGPYTTEIYKCDPDRRTRLDAQRWEACGHTWVAFPSSDDTWGVAYVNDSKYGFDVVRDTFGATIVRGPDYPGVSGNSYAAVERSSRGCSEVPTHADQGEHLVKFALIPFSGSWRAASIPKFAHCFNAPPACRLVSVAPGSQPPAVDWFPVVCSPGNLEVVAMKLPEGPVGDEGSVGVEREVLLRVVETGRTGTRGTLSFPPSLGVTAVELVDILERDWGEKSPEISRTGGFVTKCAVDWGPHEVLTFRLTCSQ
ncbi:MAG: alpha-mannosidase [Promethearchaeota archaeon]